MDDLINLIGVASDWWSLLIMLSLIIVFGYFIYGVLNKRKPRREWLHSKNIKASMGLRNKLINNFSDGEMIAYLKKIDPMVFEELILTSLDACHKDLKVTRSPRYTVDGGVDGLFTMGGDKYLIQAKRYKDHISAAHVKLFISAVRDHGAKGLFVHTGKTGALSKSLLRCSDIKLISGSNLVRLIKYGSFDV